VVGFNIVACAFHSILEAAMLDFAVFSLSHGRTHIRSATVRLAHLLFGEERLLFRRTNGLLRSANDVGCGSFIAKAKTIAIRFLLPRRKARIAVLVSIVHIGQAVFFQVPARAFNTVAEALPLNLLHVLGRRIPAKTILSVCGGARRILLKAGGAGYA
jgi:hypothetical protein